MNTVVRSVYDFVGRYSQVFQLFLLDSDTFQKAFILGKWMVSSGFAVTLKKNFLLGFEEQNGKVIPLVPE